MIKRLLILLCLMAVTIGAEDDLSVYPMVFGGNSYYGVNDYTYTFVARTADLFVAGAVALRNNIRDTAIALGNTIWIGEYASSTELNMYKVPNTTQYDERLKDTASFWPVIFAQYYMDSMYAVMVAANDPDSSLYDIESLYVHWADDSVNHYQITEVSQRLLNIDTMRYNKTRFCYQYFNNTSADTFMYPGGYVWLANGMNIQTRDALAYAYLRYFIEDSVRWGPTGGHWTAFFMDNQYRAGWGPILGSYWNTVTSWGGPYSTMDWIEVPGIEATTDSARWYYDNSTLPIDSAIKHRLDSACGANGLDSIYGFGNVDKFDETQFAIQIKTMNVLLENPVDYTKSWSAGYVHWLKISDIMAGYTQEDDTTRYVCWMYMGDFTVEVVPPGAWATGDRIYMANFMCHLNLYQPNIFFGPYRFNRMDRWRSIYEVDFGSPIAGTRDTSRDSLFGSTTVKVMKRKFLHDGDTAITLMACGGPSLDFANDSIKVGLGGDYYSVDVNADTAVVAVDSVWLHPYMGWIGIQNLELPPVIGTILPASSYVDSTDNITSTISDDYGINRAICYIIPPEVAPYDTIMDSIIVTADTSVSYDFSISHLWTDSGTCYIVFVAIDDSSNTSRDSISLLIDVQSYKPVISNILPASGYTDSTDDVSALITDDYGVDSVFCYVWHPDSTPGVNNSITIRDSVLSPISASFTFTNPYTWPDPGSYWIVFVAIDQDSDTGRDSSQITVTTQGIVLETKTFNYLTGLIDAHGRSNAANTNYGTSVLLYNSQSFYHSFMVDYSMDDSLPDDWTIDSIQFIYQVEGLGGYVEGEQTHLYLSAVSDNRDWTEDGLTWNSYKTGSAWTTAGGDTAGCISDTTVVDFGDLPIGTWDTITIHGNTTYGSTYLDSVKYSTGNFGFGIANKTITGTGGELVYIRSTEYATTASRPYLIVFPSGVVTEMSDAGTVIQGTDIEGTDIE